MQFGESESREKRYPPQSLAQRPPKLPERWKVGFVAKHLLDVLFETNRYRYRKLPVVNTEGQNRLHKGTVFVQQRCGVSVR